MDETIEFDHAQADRLRRRLTNKKNTIQLALNKIEGLVESAANLHWEGKSRAEYIALYTASSAQVNNYLKRWLKDVTDLINRAKEEKLKQEEPGSVRKPRHFVELLPDNAIMRMAGPVAMADGQANSGAATYDGAANEGAARQAGPGVTNYDSSLNERAERGDRQISLSEVMNGDLGYWYEPRAGKWFERLRIYDPAPAIIVREIEPPERKPVQGAQQGAQSSATPDWPQSEPLEMPEITERELYSLLLQSYAGPAYTLNYKICNDSPDDLLDSLTRETCLISPEQLDVYNSIIAAGSYTDEQKRRMLISMALETNINDLLDMNDYDKADALKELMDRMNSQSVDAYNRFLVMIDIKWSSENNMNESIIYAITNHAEKLGLTASSEPSAPSTPFPSMSVEGIVDAIYQNLPRRYDAILDNYKIPERIKRAATILINYGGFCLDGLAIMVCNTFMLYEAEREAESNLFDSEENKLVNSAICEGTDGIEAFNGIIDDQGIGAAAQIQMGTKLGNDNGCGWVATYNILYLLGRKMQPWEIVEFYEKTGGLLFAGVIGINPEGIRTFFKSQGIKTNIDYFAVDIDEQIKKSGVAIYNYLHCKGAHYVTVEYKDGFYTIYNDGGSGAGLTVDSFDEWVKNKNLPDGIMPLSLITF